MELINFCNLSKSYTEIYSLSASAISVYFIFCSAVLIFKNLLIPLSPIGSETEKFSNIIIMSEIALFVIVRVFGPKMKAAKMLSGILFFIGSLTILFTSFGSGVLINLIGILIVLILSISQISKYLFVLLIPFTSVFLYIKIMLQYMELDNTVNIIKVWSDNYMILFIYPAILLACCDRK